MKKTILAVFGVLAVLVTIFLVWELFFADTGILHTVYNGLVNGVNQQWAKVSGEKDKGLIPLWDGGHTADEGQENKNDDSNGGFKFKIRKKINFFRGGFF